MKFLSFVLCPSLRKKPGSATGMYDMIPIAPFQKKNTNGFFVTLVMMIEHLECQPL